MNELGPALSDEPVSAPAVKRRRPALRVLGTSVTQLPAIKAAAEEDLGLELELITLDGTEAQRRGALHPESFDVYDQWFHDIDLIWPTGSIQYIDINRIHRWDEINALPKTGRLKPEFRRARGGAWTRGRAPGRCRGPLAHPWLRALLSLRACCAAQRGGGCASSDERDPIHHPFIT